MCISDSIALDELTDASGSIDSRAQSRERVNPTLPTDLARIRVRPLSRDDSDALFADEHDNGMHEFYKFVRMHMHQYTDGLEKLWLCGRGLRDRQFRYDAQSWYLLRGDVCTDESKPSVKERLSNVETPVVAGFKIRNGVSADAERAAAIFHTDITWLDVVARHK